MKLYDKIGIPGPSFATPWVASHGPFIVLTIEELSQLWNAGHRAGLSDAGRLTKQPAVDFDQYMASKGINITNNGAKEI